jgi:hypothetical protein
MEVSMTLGDATYLKHFHWMVTEGIVCGLGHPIEWLVGYGRGIGVDYSKLGEIDEFVALASKELHEIMHAGMDPKDIPSIKQWVDDFYNQPSCGGCCGKKE